MTTAPEPEDEIRALLDGLELEEPTDVVNVSSLSNRELSRRYVEVQNAIRTGGEILVAKTRRGRELHSLNSALIHELHKRGLR